MLAWAKNSAAYRLSRQMMTEKQLETAIRKKAKEKFSDLDEAGLNLLAETAIAFGRDMKVLDDTSYAEIKTKSGQRGGRSRRQIRQKLIQKGISSEEATAATAETDDLAAALVYTKKRRFGAFRLKETDPAGKLKEMASLARQGFSYDIARAALAMEREEAEDTIFAARL